MNLNALVVAVLFVIVTAPALAQDRHGTFILVIRDEPGELAFAWLNTLHMHSIQPCYPAFGSVQDEFYACVHMDDDASNSNRIFRTAERYAPAVREILNLPNPTTPAAVVSGPDAATVGEPITLTVEVTDPDFGDSWRYYWRESSATMNGGTFDTRTQPTTIYTPAITGAVILAVTVVDDAQQSVIVTHQVTVTE